MRTRAPIAVLFGTRPEAIKLAPVILALRTQRVPHAVITTGQHARMVGEVLGLFGIAPDVDLGLMRQPQSLDYLLTQAVLRVGEQLDRIQPSAVIVQGDTTSMLGSVLAAFHRGIPVAHVEAGLRSSDISLPFPEEMNRRAASLMTRWHFAPTARAAANLRAERVSGEIHVVGNTVVDAIRTINEGPAGSLPTVLADFIGEGPYLLATAHRRESWGAGIAGIAAGLRDALHALPDHRLVFVAHPNPAARGPVDQILGTQERACVIDALPYADFLRLLRRAQVVVSDSGGVQEEGPTLGVPVLVTRTVTERHEGVAAGAVRLIGTDAVAVRDATLGLLAAPAELAAMAQAGRGLYGDGHAAARIARLLSVG
jgi:UDP-N-acetylglucosamine 2-epimerase (non-hydrolysing)